MDRINAFRDPKNNEILEQRGIKGLTESGLSDPQVLAVLAAHSPYEVVELVDIAGWDEERFRKAEQEYGTDPDHAAEMVIELRRRRRNRNVSSSDGTVLDILLGGMCP